MELVPLGKRFVTWALFWHSTAQVKKLYDFYNVRNHSWVNVMCRERMIHYNSETTEKCQSHSSSRKKIFHALPHWWIQNCFKWIMQTLYENSFFFLPHFFLKMWMIPYKTDFLLTAVTLFFHHTNWLREIMLIWNLNYCDVLSALWNSVYFAINK